MEGPRASERTGRATPPPTADVPSQPHILAPPGSAPVLQPVADALALDALALLLFRPLEGGAHQTRRRKRLRQRHGVARLPMCQQVRRGVPVQKEIDPRGRGVAAHLQDVQPLCVQTPVDVELRLDDGLARALVQGDGQRAPEAVGEAGGRRRDARITRSDAVGRTSGREIQEAQEKHGQRRAVAATHRAPKRAHTDPKEEGAEERR